MTYREAKCLEFLRAVHQSLKESNYVKITSLKNYHTSFSRAMKELHIIRNIGMKSSSQWEWLTNDKPGKQMAIDVCNRASEIAAEIRKKYREVRAIPGRIVFSEVGIKVDADLEQNQIWFINGSGKIKIDMNRLPWLSKCLGSIKKELKTNI